MVVFMVPGLALFYGGMGRSKNVLNMLMMNMVCLGIVPVFWFVGGYSLSSVGVDGGLIGNFDAFFLNDIGIVGEDGGTGLRDVFFALTFASITPALISGAVADRIKFSAWMVFVPTWMLLVFTPTWAWVFGGGWLATREVASLDFAGGTVVHVAAGASSLALALVLGNRKGWPTEPMPPHSLPLTMLGAGILWFGWFGFNAGSAFEANNVAIQAFANTFIAAAAAMLTWLMVEKIVDGHATTLGAASGIVAGLVGITPGAGFMGVAGALGVGAAAGALCAMAVRIKFRFGYDDALDVVGVHMVGGLVGGLLIGLFASPATLGGDFAAGIIDGGGIELLIEQIIANGAVGIYAFVVTYGIAVVMKTTMGLRVTEDDELVGLDTALHSESAYS